MRTGSYHQLPSMIRQLHQGQLNPCTGFNAHAQCMLQFLCRECHSTTLGALTYCVDIVWILCMFCVLMKLYLQVVSILILGHVFHDLVTLPPSLPFLSFLPPAGILVAHPKLRPRNALCSLIILAVPSSSEKV